MASESFPKWFGAKHEDSALKRTYGTAPLGRFLAKDSDITGIRDAISYEESELQGLITSLNADGELRMQNPPHVYLSDDAENLLVVGGNRRITAALTLLAKGQLTGEPIVACYLYETKDRREILRLAATDNAFRLNYNEMEEFRQIVVLSGRGMGDGEIATTMGMDVRTVGRYLSISRYSVLVDLLKAKMPYSKLARIAEKLEDRTPEVKAKTILFLKRWLEALPARIEKKKAEGAKRNKTVKDTDLTPGKMLNAGEYEGWMRDLEEGNAPTGRPKIKMVTVEDDGAKLKIDAVNLEIKTVTLPELAALLARFESKVIPALKKAMQRKKVESMDDEDLDATEAELIRKYLGESQQEPPDDLEPTDDTDDDTGNAGFDEDA